MDKREKRLQRKKRIKKSIRGSKAVPRLVVFRSNQHIYAQIVDDEQRATLVAASDVKAKTKNKKESAEQVGKDLAQAAQKKKIIKVVFDRGGYKYHGRIKVLADAARAGGLIF